MFISERNVDEPREVAACGYVPGIRSGGGTADRFPYKETGSGAAAGGGIRREYGPYTCC